MIFIQTPLAGLFIVDAQPVGDARGSFARIWCQREFEQKGLTGRVVQANISRNHLKGTLRGMHWQAAPHPEAKLVRCTRGALFDVAVDLRQESVTYLRWFGTELNERSGRMLFIPVGFAHGFVTLTDETDVSYLMSEFYFPECQRGARYDDPSFAIEWPVEPSVVASKDTSWPDFSGGEDFSSYP